jgi:hypothetical protein
MLQVNNLNGFAGRQISTPINLVPGLAGKFFNGDWRSTISTGNIGTLPLTTANDSSNVTGTGGLPSPAYRYGVNLWPYITYDSLGDFYGFIAIGYFIPPTTGTYTIYTSSDDGSGVWIGDLALPGATRTTANATLDNGMGTGQGNTKRSNTISLTAGIIYPIRIVHEEGGGLDNLTFSWAGPGIAENTDLLTHFRTSVNDLGVLTGDYGITAGPSTFVQRVSPIFNSISPNVVPSSGNTLITITGSQFRSPMEVSFAGLSLFASNVTVVNSTTLTAVTPNATTIPGNRQVRISNSLGSATIGGAINFLAPLASPVAAQAAGLPAGTYDFQSGGMTSPVSLEYQPNYYEGRPFCCVFRSPYRATATTNRIDLSIPMAGLLVQRDALDHRAAVYWSTPITYNTVGGSGNNTANSGYSPRRVILGGAGGHGIFNTNQTQCNWSDSAGAIGAGFDGGTCGSFPNDLVWGTGQSGTATYTNRSGTWSHWVTWG